MHLRVRIPSNSVQDWKTLFSNGSSAQIVFNLSENNEFLVIPTPACSASNSTSDSAKTSTTLVVAGVSLVVVAILAALVCIVLARQRARQLSGETSSRGRFLTAILASRNRKCSASPSLLEDRWSEWSTSSRNIRNAQQPSTKRTTLVSNSNALLTTAQTTPKRTPVVLYELGSSEVEEFNSHA